ncbi:MAG TPA: thioredoxin family protein [Gemmataceae bacterium]|nr:thioredoxin family protein [Gemmataceae bacterium]
MLIFDKWPAALRYGEFLAKYGSPDHQARWQQTLSQIQLNPRQRELLQAFRREMKVLCLAGAWCGDCSGQCPIFERFQEVTPTIQVRYLDRDDHADAQRELQINGGNRVPVLVFFSEDGFQVARYGERTLSKYRAMMQAISGANMPSEIATKSESLLDQVVQDWLNEFERAQWILRLSPRLRQVHGD